MLIILAIFFVSRSEGFRGRLVLLCEEDHLPYYRPGMSRDLAPPSPVLPPEFYEKNKIEVWLGADVTTLDAEKRP